MYVLVFFGISEFGFMECSVCQEKSFQHMFSKKGYNFVKCHTCGLLKVDLSQSNFNAKKHYIDYFRGETGDYLDYVADKDTKILNFKMFYSFIRECIAPPGRLLDVGAGLGFFLEVAMEEFQVEAVELSASGCDYMRKHYNFPVYEGTLESLELPEASYDVITSFDCIEHLERPDLFIAQVFRLLKPEGFVFISTLDVDAMLPRLMGKRWRLYIPPSHLHYFSARTLKLLLESQGLKVVNAKHHSLYRGLHNSIFYGLFYRGKSVWKKRIYKLFSPFVPNINVKLYTGDLIFVAAQKYSASSIYVKIRGTNR